MKSAQHPVSSSVPAQLGLRLGLERERENLFPKIMELVLVFVCGITTANGRRSLPKP